MWGTKQFKVMHIENLIFTRIFFKTLTYDMRFVKSSNTRLTYVTHKQRDQTSCIMVACLEKTWNVQFKTIDRYPFMMYLQLVFAFKFEVQAERYNIDTTT